MIDRFRRRRVRRGTLLGMNRAGLGRQPFLKMTNGATSNFDGIAAIIGLWSNGCERVVFLAFVV